MPGVIIVDDEVGARRGLRRLLEAHDDVRILGEAENVAAAKDLLAEATPDLVFLDIEMPGGNGFGLLEALRPETKVIFVTAHSHHAVKAFEVDAVDYLLKPLDPDRLATALLRARQRVEAAAVRPPRYNRDDHLTLRDGRRTFVVPIRKIVALEADGDLTRFLISESKPLLISQTLGRFAKILPDPPFVRINRSLIVNLDKVEALENTSRNASLLFLQGNEKPIGLRRITATRLREALGLGR
ncbi:response regulator transcription factor [Luteolibacter yonseiensis]|uniref:Response regulator transcription factor n=1 Tax=Luteolibacter yonseiensis TaxID=1144680 RepID=A0A934R4H8_9BACT|nr:LytTR family DNA-binding domain-containing protein [Luteolibacter yonseiensis]MBK1818253.1 response regulator transcription factor [Luteolibacter yonseiensis]